jgi:methylase of polypeptide subunit release factors
MISKAKCDALSWELKDMAFNLSMNQEDEERIQYTFPKEIARKFERWGTIDEGMEYEKQISKELSRISYENGIVRELDKISLSDALTKKFNIRMMGTGSGRFALEIAKKPLKAILDTNYKNQIKALQVIALLKQIYHLQIPDSTVENGDAVNRSVADNSFDIIVTSPPYLPASSGREDYLVGKLISLKAMGLLQGNSQEYYAGKSVGSMDNLSDDSLSCLPDSVNQLYNWLINDELRAIKAKPIVSYYNSIRKSLMEDKRTIKEDGKIIYIIGKESIFYSLATKEILYKVECDKIFAEIAESVGLKVDEIINIELDKKNAVARPRSTDKYYECAIIMSK